MKTIDVDMKLDGFRLQDALEAMYNMLSAVLLGHGVAESPDLFQRKLPEMVFEASVGAGWLEFAEEVPWNITEKTVLPQWVLDHIKRQRQTGLELRLKKALTKNEAQRLVQFGEFYIERSYLASFYNLLAETISFHSAKGSLHEERLKSLPAFTSQLERKSLLQAYVAECKVKGKLVRMNNIASLAGVDYSTLTKWKNGKILDSADPARRISLLLRFDEKSRARSYRRAAIR